MLNSVGILGCNLAWQIAAFLVLILLLRRFAYKPILKMLEERRRQIAQGLADSEKIAAELKETANQRQQVLLQANSQATKLIEEAHTAAARVGQQETQKAIAAGEQILVKSREAAAQEHARMLLELKREVGQLVVQTTATVAGRILTPEDQRRMAEETVKQLTPAA